MLVKMETGGGGGGATPTISMGELNCYDSPQTFECTNAMFLAGTSYNWNALALMGYVVEGVLTITYTNNASATYSDGVLKLQDYNGSAYGKVYIAYW